MTVKLSHTEPDPDLHDNDTDLQSVFSRVRQVLPQCRDVTVADYISVDSDLETACEVSMKDIAETMKEGGEGEVKS